MGSELKMEKWGYGARSNVFVKKRQKYVFYVASDANALGINSELYKAMETTDKKEKL